LAALVLSDVWETDETDACRLQIAHPTPLQPERPVVGPG
jgi:hypothetical protein